MDTAISTMSVPAPTTRPPRATVPNAELVARVDLTPTMAIFRVRPDGPTPAFEPGQYLTLGITLDGRFVQRPYSTSSAPATTEPLEFLVRLVAGATFTPLLWALPLGGRLRLGPPRGLLRMDRGDDRTHLFVATGTGLAPFMSMIRTELRATRAVAPRVIVVHGTSREPELAYRATLTRWDRDQPNVVYRPVLSRPAAVGPTGWSGHIGRLDTALGPICDELALDPSDTTAYVCGNPGMIASVEALLRGRGFPGTAVRTEGYWVS